MKIWLDAHLSPAIAGWIDRVIQDVEAASVLDMGLHEAEDIAIFERARAANAIFITKDIDIAHLLNRFGPPPKVIWLRCGNTSNARLRDILEHSLSLALEMLEGGEDLVEIAE